MTPTDPEAVSEPVNGVLAEYMRRIDGGERIDRERFLREHPEAADQLREYFENLDALHCALGLPGD